MRDVRMKGFAQRADVEEVDHFLAQHARALPAEDVPLLECVGRVLAEDIVSAVDVPGFARSAMDGYAVRGEDTFGASDYDPIPLALLGVALPGKPHEGRVERGQSVRIMTGAPVPEGADAVVMAEVCEELGALGDAGHRVLVRDAVAPQKNVGAVGEDVREGDELLRAGRRLRPQDAGVLASIGRASLRCVPRPRVRLVITGDELLPAGSPPGGSRIVDSNSVVLRALVLRDGGELLPFEILPDQPELIREAMDDPRADVVLVSGGSSVGQEDHAPRLLAEIGKLDFHGVSMRPSSPVGVGRLPALDSAAGVDRLPPVEGAAGAAGSARATGVAERFAFLLPGNPVSCLCAYEFFAGPTLRALGGRPRAWPHRRLRVPLARKIASAIGRTDYVRVAVEGGRAVPLATSGASILSSTVRAAGCVIVPREREGMPEGDEVEVLLYDEELPT